MILLRYIDLVILVLALPVFLLADWPMAGYATGAVAWLLQRGVQVYATHKAEQQDDVKKIVGITAGSMIGRGWLAALTIFAGYGLAGGEDDVGLSAAVLVVVLFTAYFTASIVLRPFQQQTPSHP